ncbi:MAG: ABC transporter permease [Candidatus Algichlamydia australiensis]|nr:ABC transporter permease [Chlamydiales bacterium]
MLRFVLRKISNIFFSLFCVATITFILMKVIPGDPLMKEQAVPEEIMKQLYAHYGLDQPLYIQYGKYLKGVATFNLGPSFTNEGQTTGSIIKQALPYSFALGIQALILSITCGITLGSLAACYQGKWVDRLTMVIAALGISIPNYLIGALIQYLFAIKLGWLPVARMSSFAHTIMPTLSLAALPTAYIARLTRAQMIEVLSQDYVMTAYAKGLSKARVIFRHVLKNSLTPVVTYLGQLMSLLLTGNFVIERIFGIPGLGGWFVKSVINRDYTVIMGITIFYSAVLMGFIFLTEILYLYLDPKVRAERLYAHK